MMKLNCVLPLLGLLIMMVSAKVSANYIDKPNITGILYPSEDTNKNRRPMHDRPPISDPRLCHENELLYPGDNDGDWVCDCKPGYLHFPETGLCHESYSRGPCQDGEVFRLMNSTISNIPECVKNDCDTGKVLFEGKCHTLNSPEGCERYSKFIGRIVLLVPNPTTPGLICSAEDLSYECVANCCLGSRRHHRDICGRQRAATQNKQNKKATETAV